MLTERKERILHAVSKQSDELFYDFVTGIREWFKEAMLPNETFIFDEPCDNFYGYVIYAIHNYDGVILVDTILNGDPDKKRRITSKGLESLNMYDAMRRYYNGAGKSIINPENNKNNVGIYLGNLV